jgi:hypothetical protein
VRIAAGSKLTVHVGTAAGGKLTVPVGIAAGGRLTVQALQLLGLSGLGSWGGFERLHYLFERAFDGPDLSLAFLKVTPFAYMQSSVPCHPT